MDKSTEIQSAATTVSQTDDAVGVPKGNKETKHWYIAIVNNKSEKLCLEKLQQRIRDIPNDEKPYNTYVAIQKEMRIDRTGKRKMVDRIVFPALLFIRCTERVRRKEIVYLPYIKRFMVNIAGSPQNDHHPVATIPDHQMRNLMRMIGDAEAPVTIDSYPLHLGERVRVNGGKLIGLEGNVYDNPDGSTELVILIDTLGCAKVSIARDLLDPVTRSIQ